MQTIVFIETNKSGSSREAVKAAYNMGYLTVLLTKREKVLIQRDEYPDVHQMYYCDVEDIECLKEKIQLIQLMGLEIKLIISFVDPYVYTASLLMDKFIQNNKLNSESIIKMEDKYETRKNLAGKTYTPYFVLYNGEQDISSFSDGEIGHLPLIIKSPLSSGSKDVLLANTKKQLVEHISFLRSKYKNQPVLLEEYVEGPQYLVEAIAIDGNPNIIAVIEQEITKKQRFIVTGYCVLADVNKHIYESLKSLIQSITTSLGFLNGALHLELRKSPNGWKLIEINPRISGGAMNKMIQTAFGINLVEETLQFYLGKELQIEPKHKKYVFTQYITLSTSGILRKVTGKKMAQNSPGVVEVFVKPRKGAMVSIPFSMGNRYAYVIASGDRKEEATRLAKSAAAKLTFHLTPL